jgi:hypothetical protein
VLGYGERHGEWVRTETAPSSYIDANVIRRYFDVYRNCKSPAPPGRCSIRVSREIETTKLMNTQVLFSVTAALCIVCCFYGSGQMSSSLPPAVVSKGTKVRHLNILVEGAILNRIALLYCGILLLYQRHVHQALGGCRALAYCCHSQSLCLVPLGAHGCRNHCCTGFRCWHRKHLYV